ncbi:MAG: hypothetical protein U1F56_15900 [Rubrivivax sp.]
MHRQPLRHLPHRHAATLALALLAAGIAPHADAAEPPQQAIEKALQAAQQDKKGVTLHVSGQAIGGGVVRIEPGQVVELKSQQYGRIVVRIDRIDALLMP